MNTLNDIYTRDVLEIEYIAYRNYYITRFNTKKNTGLPIRLPNPPEDVTENIAKFIIINYENDPSCKWAKSIQLTGDLYSDKYTIEMPPEVKAFTSDGPSSFGPKKKFGVLYFLDMRDWLNNRFILWKVNVSSDSVEWHDIKMNKTETNEDQCNQKRRPHISWENIYSQLPDKSIKVYDGTFEGIFIQQPTSLVAVQ
jgi:hypothetical protein